MKKYFMLGCLAAMQLYFVSCKKTESPDNIDITPYSGSNVNLLYGTWELRSTYGSLGNCQNAQYAPGNGNMWKFSDAGYEEYENNQIFSSGKYILSTDNCEATGRIMETIVLPQSNYLKMYCDISKDSLILYRSSAPSDLSIARLVRMGK